MNIFPKGKKDIYLDYAATTPVADNVFQAMRPYFSEFYANPSSLHRAGQKAQSALDEARAVVAEMLGATWKEVIFVPSATESINLVLRGVIKEAQKNGNDNPHIVTTNIEHSAVLKTARELEEKGVEVTYISANEDGLITADQVREALKENTVLVSVMYVNNEIGTIQPIPEIAKVIRDFRSTKHEARNSIQTRSTKFKARNGSVSDLKTGYPLFHTDAVQATNYLDINADNLGADFITLSGHKIYGPKGAGVLYSKENSPVTPVITGGDQERGMHAGTENIPSIIGFARALRGVEEIKKEEEARVRKMRDSFISAVLQEAGDKVVLNGSHTQRVANNANFCFYEKESETLIPAFDAEGIYVSGGSACTSRVPEPSHVISALGREEYAKSAIRFTLGRYTQESDIEYAADVTIKIANS